MANAKLRSAVVGLGHSGPNGHLPALSRNPRTELTAICDVDEERVRRYSGKHGSQGFTDVESMLDGCDLDWVHVCTPVQSHFGIAKRVIENEAHLLVQKPVTVTVAELDELTELAEGAGIQLSAVHNQRFIPTIRFVEKQINSGELGEVRAVETVFAGEGRPEVSPRGAWVFDLAGGELEEGLPHPIYLTLATGGYPLDSDAISITKRALEEYDHGISYDGTSVEYVADNGALCSIKVFAEGVPRRTVNVHGDDKSISVDMISMNVRTYGRSDGRPSPVDGVKRGFGDVSSILKGIGLNSIEFLKYVSENTFGLHSESSSSGTYYQINEEAKSIRSGTESPVSVEEARWTIEIMERIRGRR